jgi:molecular chaperone DnaK (HSP70)
MLLQDSAKSFMRTCALEAGLISERNSQSLALALEPEAACLSTEQAGSFLVTGDKFMVLDCGGGTVDITMHRSVCKLAFYSLCTCV